MNVERVVAIQNIIANLIIPVFANENGPYLKQSQKLLQKQRGHMCVICFDVFDLVIFVNSLFLRKPLIT